jgi:hypothetical protein
LYDFLLSSRKFFEADDYAEVRWKGREAMANAGATTLELRAVDDLKVMALSSA